MFKDSAKETLSLLNWDLNGFFFILNSKAKDWTWNKDKERNKKFVYKIYFDNITEDTRILNLPIIYGDYKFKLDTVDTQYKRCVLTSKVVVVSQLWRKGVKQANMGTKCA